MRFFGVENVQDLYRSQGMAIEQAGFVVRTPEMTEFVHRRARLPADVRTALQRNRFSHVGQVVSRAAAAERVGKAVDLMSVPVTPPDAETEAYFALMIGSQKLDPDRDTRSTIGPAPLEPETITLRTRPKRSWRRLLGLKR